MISLLRKKAFVRETDVKRSARIPQRGMTEGSALLSYKKLYVLASVSFPNAI